MDDIAEVAFIQCKYSFRQSAKHCLTDVDKHALINYAKDCGAIPVFSYSDDKGHANLINLLTGKEFIP